MVRRFGSLMNRSRRRDGEIAASRGDFGGTFRPDSSDRGQPLVDHRPESPWSCVFDGAQLSGQTEVPKPAGSVLLVVWRIRVGQPTRMRPIQSAAAVSGTVGAMA